jgi:uncharacterized protein YeeX (DUF496 family)
MKEEFELSVKNGKDCGLYSDLEHYLQKIVEDIDNKIRNAQKRVEELESKVNCTQFGILTIRMTMQYH